MGQTIPEPAMVKYQFEIEDETWQEWKETVPRSKSLEQRIIELIEADRDGRVEDPRVEVEVDDDTTTADYDLGESIRRQLENEDLDAGKMESIIACVRYLEDVGEASPGDFKDNVHPDHPDGSTNPDWWWGEIVSDRLKMLEEVNYVHQRLIEYDG